MNALLLIDDSRYCNYNDRFHNILPINHVHKYIIMCMFMINYCVEITLSMLKVDDSGS